MSKNVGTIDQYARIVVGLALIAFAFQDGLAIQGWHWAGLGRIRAAGDRLLQKLPGLRSVGDFDP